MSSEEQNISEGMQSSTANYLKVVYKVNPKNVNKDLGPPKVSVEKGIISNLNYCNLSQI